ncbi:CBS domain-containing protein [Rhodopirellula sallentina]|uniref:CBS domain-containing protein n=1 Tax=Rhodopirellula sallentina SM41 TaxID=1263870 RepID=M5UJT6_9BACT|nr:hypothetical protein [Rhodopirellula sallentina]EMI56268.1 hypothetical protein RSSM_02287 [Rhodopirellula sallentina SM41]
MSESSNNTGSRQRPGPFGPARALLPFDQQMVMLDSKTLAGDAIERMLDERFSQIPVAGRSGSIVGVFSWKSFGWRVADLRSTAIKPTDLAICDAMEPARFIGPDVYIDTETDWSDLDYVLVGTPNDLMGILCVADVFGRLNDFAEAFVLIYEVEHAIRDIIEVVYDSEELQAVLDSLVESANRPAIEAVTNLKEFIEENGHTPAVGKAIKLLKTSRAREIESLKDLTFSQYRSIICCEKNWDRFEPVFDSMRALVDKDLSDVNELRNVVFHFRRAITPRDTDRLRRFREKLRYNLELYHRELARDGEETIILSPAE